MTTRSLTRKQLFRSPAEHSTCEHLHQIHPQSEAHFPATVPSRDVTGFRGRAGESPTEIPPPLSDPTTTGTSPAGTDAAPAEAAQPPPLRSVHTTSFPRSCGRWAPRSW